MTRSAFALLLLLVILTRLPYLSAGYGTDPDAWRVAAVSTTLWHTGAYEPSRLPGYPLHEILTAPFAGEGGALLSNAATLICSLVVLLVWHRIVLREARYPSLLVIVLAFTPLFWKNSAVTMDYVWSLLFILLAFEAALHERPALAGIMAGLAAGFRPGNAIACAALVVPFLAGPHPLRSAAIFISSAGAVMACAFAPLMMHLGLHIWVAAASAQVHAVRAGQDTGAFVALYRGTYALGPLALLCMAWIFMRELRVLRTIVLKQDTAIATALAMVLTFGALFIWLPMEREYLLPAVPFLLLLVDRVCTRRQMLLTGILIISYAFIDPDVVAHEGITGHFQPSLRQGMVLEDLQKARTREEQRVMILSQHTIRPLIVLTGFPEPFWFADPRIDPVPSSLHEQLFRNRADTLVLHVYAISRSELASIRTLGYEVAVLRGAERFVEQAGGFSIAGEHLAVVPPLP